MANPRDHGGGLDAAVTRHGGARADWIDLSTGINPVPYPVPSFAADVWTALPDRTAQTALINAAHQFWQVPKGAAVLAAPGASCLIANLPALTPKGQVHIPAPTYNEHGAAFVAHGWTLSEDRPDAKVIVHPNNPTGHWYRADALTAPLTIIDESFADVAPDRSLVSHAAWPGVVVLKSFGKFWGLAGLRLGFAIATPDTINRLADLLGPWPVSGPALEIGRKALSDHTWATETRNRLSADADRLDQLMIRAGAVVEGGCPLFRLYHVENAKALQTQLAKHHIWSRIFPYSRHWLRLGLPAPDQWNRLEAAL